MSRDENDSASLKLGGLLKKAVSLGAGAYVTAEDKIKGTLSSVQLPKELIKETLETFFEAYTISINAEIRLTPKRKFDAPARPPKNDTEGAAT